MSSTPEADSVIKSLTGLRQSRRFQNTPVPQDILRDLLNVARWSGSSKNSQPWEFIVVDDPETIRALSEAGAYAGFLANAPLVIVIVLNGQSPRSEAYDEGRVSERIMLAASAHGLGSGTGWFSLPENKQQVREILGIPEDRDVWSAVAIGYPDAEGHRVSGVGGGRKPLEEIVSYGRFSERGSAGGA